MWAHFKRQHGLTSPLERNFMEEGGREIYLCPRDGLHVHAALQPLRPRLAAGGGRCDQLLRKAFLASASPGGAAAPRQFTVTVRGPQQVVSVLKLDVVPQPFVVDARIHYHAVQEEQLATRIPVHHVPGMARCGAATPQLWHVHCTEPNAVVEITKSGLQTSGRCRSAGRTAPALQPGTAPSVRSSTSCCTATGCAPSPQACGRWWSTRWTCRSSGRR